MFYSIVNLSCTAKAWIAFFIGSFLGVVVGIFVIGLLVHSREKGRNDAPAHLENQK